MMCSHYALNGRNYFEHFDHLRKCTVFYSFFTYPSGVFLLCLEGVGMDGKSSWGLLEGAVCVNTWQVGVSVCVG